MNHKQAAAAETTPSRAIFLSARFMVCTFPTTLCYMVMAMGIAMRGYLPSFARGVSAPT